MRSDARDREHSNVKLTNQHVFCPFAIQIKNRRPTDITYVVCVCVYLQYKVISEPVGKHCVSEGEKITVIYIFQ